MSKIDVDSVLRVDVLPDDSSYSVVTSPILNSYLVRVISSDFVTYYGARSSISFVSPDYVRPFTSYSSALKLAKSIVVSSSVQVDILGR